MAEMVTIPLEEYTALQQDSDFLNALQYAGVDNWDGYSMAWRYLENGEEI